jgi:hypothetical protein
MHRMSVAWTTLQLLTISVLSAAVVTSACSSDRGGAKDQRGTTSETTSAADSNRTRPGAAAQVASEVPKLPKKIEAMTPEDFMRVVDGVSWTGHLFERECAGAFPRCSSEPGHKSTWVRHEAAAGANDLKFGAALPENGVVVSRMQNLGKHTEKFHKLPSGKGEWYAILTRAGNDVTANLQLVSLDFDGNGKPKLKLMDTIFTVSQCDTTHHDSASAGFKGCGDTTSVTSPIAVPTSFNRGAWFTCSLGCCTTGSVTIGADSAAADSARRQQRPR